MFQLSGGTLQGRQHALLGRNSQDAFAWAERDGRLAAVVCDGCGSAPHSEAGARIGARIAVEELLRHGTDLPAARTAILGRLTKVAAALEGAAGEYLLFTLVGAVVAEEAVVFSCGDGLLAVNGAGQALGPDEAPPYLAYALLPGTVGEPALSAFIERRRLPATELISLALGTDGALELLGGGLDVLAEDPLVWSNPDGLRRRLVQLRRQGLFADDATLVLLRRAL